jgi:hypothetical protein
MARGRSGASVCDLRAACGVVTAIARRSSRATRPAPWAYCSRSVAAVSRVQRRRDVDAARAEPHHHGGLYTGDGHWFPQ